MSRGSLVRCRPKSPNRASRDFGWRWSARKGFRSLSLRSGPLHLLLLRRPGRGLVDVRQPALVLTSSSVLVVAQCPAPSTRLPESVEHRKQNGSRFGLEVLDEDVRQEKDVPVNCGCGVVKLPGVRDVGSLHTEESQEDDHRWLEVLLAQRSKVVA